MWFYLMQIILILRSIRTFAIKNLSGPSYHGFCLRLMNWWLGSIITRFHKKFYPNFPFLLSAQVSPKECQDKGRFAPSLKYHKTQRATVDVRSGVG